MDDFISKQTITAVYHCGAWSCNKEIKSFALLIDKARPLNRWPLNRGPTVARDLSSGVYIASRLN